MKETRITACQALALLDSGQFVVFDEDDQRVLVKQDSTYPYYLAFESDGSTTRVLDSDTLRKAEFKLVKEEDGSVKMSIMQIDENNLPSSSHRLTLLVPASVSNVFSELWDEDEADEAYEIYLYNT